MHYNKYSRYSNPDMIKFMPRPRKGLVAEGADLNNYYSGDDTLNLLVNFGLEMMKFFPALEQLSYAGRMTPEDMEKDESYELWHGKGDDGKATKVTYEWLEAFNQYTLNGKTNEATIKESELNGWDELHENGHHTIDDGFGNRQNWISGMHHRTGSFGNFGSQGGLSAGGGAGSAYKNIDFLAEGNEWNHIRSKTKQKKYVKAEALSDNTKLTLQATGRSILFGTYGQSKLSAADDDRLQEISGLRGVTSWTSVQNILNNTKLYGTNYAGDHGALSYYDIVMQGTYKNLDADEGFLLIAAMYESRARAWEAMRQIFGPVTATHSDADMIEAAQRFIAERVPYRDSHAIGFLSLFLETQHSFLNRCSAFYKPVEVARYGFENSLLDDVKFREFSTWAGRASYTAGGLAKANDDPEGENYYRLTGRGGKLFEYRDDLWENCYDDEKIDKTEKAKLDAVDQLIENWFGATYSDNTPTTMQEKVNTGYGWDRKWKTIDDIAGHNSAHGNQSYISPNADPGHAEYVQTQFNQMNEAMVMGPSTLYRKSWVVNAFGNLLRNGANLDRLRIMEKIEEKRNNSVDFKKDQQDYLARKEDLEYEKAQEEKMAYQAQQRRAAGVRKKNKGPSGISGVSKANKSGLELKKRQQQGKPQNNDAVGAKVGSKAYQAKMQQVFAGMYKKSLSKTKAFLNKMKEATK